MRIDGAADAALLSRNALHPGGEGPATVRGAAHHFFSVERAVFNCPQNIHQLSFILHTGIRVV